MCGCSVLRTILCSVSSLAVLVGAGRAHAVDAARLRLDLPPGPLSVAVAALAERSGVSIGTSDPSLLAIHLPAVHLQGTATELILQLVRMAGVGAARTGPSGWQVVRAAPAVPPLQPGRDADPPRSTVAPVVVQASKRAELLSDYPAEVVRVAGAELGRYGGVSNTGGLSALAPILTSTDWGEGQEKLFLRGVADSSFTGASPTLVGEYLGDQPLTYEAPDPDLRLYDVSSVEVLAGPQGALYGSGALAGAIRIEPNAPELDRLGGSAWLGGGGATHGAASGDFGGVVNLPLVDGRLGLRAVGYAINDGGYIDDIERGLKDVNETLTRGGRVTLRWAPVDGWTVDFGGVVQRIANRDAAYDNPADAPWTRSSPLSQPSTDTFAASSVTVSGRVGGVDLRSTTGFVDQSLRERFEVLGSGHIPGRFDQVERPQQVTQELRASGGGAATTWVAGVSYLAQWEGLARDYGNLSTPPIIATLRQRTDELTGYGEATQRLGYGVSLTLGLRYAHDRQAGDLVDDQTPLFSAVQIVALVHRKISLDGGEHHVLPSAALSYQLAPKTLLYMRYGTGVRLGGLTPSSTSTHYASDHISTLETGFKRGVAGRDRILLSLSGAYSRWTDIQAEQPDSSGLPQVVNIGDGQVYSLDAAVTVRLAAGLKLDTSGFLASSRLDPATPTARPTSFGLPDVARNGGVAALDYQRPSPWFGGSVFEGGVRVQHIGPSVLELGSLLARPQGDYTTVAVGGGLRHGPASIQLNVSNLLNSDRSVFGIGSPLIAFSEKDITPIRPRTIRLGLRYDL
jgi:iron complex outermembrane recepter protein